MAAQFVVIVSFAVLLGACVIPTAYPFGSAPRWRPKPLRLRVGVSALLAALVFPLIAPALPERLIPWSFRPVAQAAEVLNAPEYIDVALMPNSQVGAIFVNDAGGGSVETRFKRYFVEQGMDPSTQLSTASSGYPQLASFQGKVIAAYVDNRGGPTANELLFRVSTDNGTTWGAEYAPFGIETFNSFDFAPLLMTSRDGLRLYVFSCCVGGTFPGIPQYRVTTDTTLVTWTAPAAAGDTSMAQAAHNSCGNSGAECARAHNFSFMETATAGQWVYIAKSASGFGQSGRGTQVGSLGGAWSAQVDHGGSGGISGCCGESNATTFLDRSGNVYYIRVDHVGQNLYYQKSSDSGFTWGPQVYAYSNTLDLYTTGSPVGLYVPGYSKGEYVWYAGFGGIGSGNDQNAVRVVPLWSGPKPYVDTATARLFGSAGGDWDFGTAYPFTFGRRDIPTGIGAYKTSADDLAIPGRLLNVGVSRSYNSADTETGPFGAAWTHTFNWSLLENGSLVQIRHGDGRRDAFTRNPASTYATPPNVFDVLTKNPDSSFTLTLKNQTKYEFAADGKLMDIHEPAGNQLTLSYDHGRLVTVLDSVNRPINFAYSSGTNIAVGKTYTKSVEADPAYPDSNGTELTDDTIGSDIDYHDPAWQGHLNLAAPLDVTVDLAVSRSLGFMRSFFDEDIAAGIFKPVSVEILTSPDNLTYTSQGTTLAASAVNDSNHLWHYDLAISASARYVRFRITKDHSWVFLSELQVYASGFAPLTTQPGTDVAQTKTYTESVAPNPSFPDTGGTELTDGNLADPNNENDPAWQAHLNLGATPLDVTVDLGSAQRVGVARSYHFQCTGCSYIRPAKVELLTSTDNITYVSRNTAAADSAVNDAGRRWRYETDLAGVTARWIRFRITAGGPWLFTSETQVFAEGAGPITLPLAHSDRIIAVSDSIGRKVTYGYDQNGRLTRVVDKLGNATGQNPLLHTWHYTYDSASTHITQVIDPDGRPRVTNTYNSEGRLVTQKDGAGNNSSFGYGPSETTVTDARGHLTTQGFDARWRLISQFDVVGQSSLILRYQYGDQWSNLTTTWDRNSNRTDYTYDTRGNVLTKTDPQINPQTPQYLTQYQYDTKNNLIQITDARGFVTTNTYDAVTNTKLSTTQRITLTPATYAITKWEYGDPTNAGLPTKIIAPRGNTNPTPDYTYSQSLSYDASGNLAARIDADGNKTTMGYDGVSRQTSMVDPDGNVLGGNPSQHTWTTVYDENDRVTTVTDPLSHSTTTFYDGAGNRTSINDRNANTTSYTYDGAARLATVQQKPDPVGQPALIYTTSLVRDANGNAMEVTQGNAVITNYVYDEINRLASFTTHPTNVLNLTTSYILDGNGNPTSRTTADNVTTNYVYDALSRLVTVSGSGLQTINYGYDELSHRTSMADVTGSSTYSYDGLGRLTQAVQPNGTLGYGYDLDSNRTALTYPTVGNVTSVFSPGGHLSSLTDWGSRQTTYTYSASGLARTALLPNGMTTTYTYDNAQRLTALSNTTASATLSSHTYTLDNEGNRTALDEVMSDAASVKVNNDVGTTVQDHPAIAIGADGASDLIWDDARNGNADIFFALRDPATGLWGANTKVNDDTGTRLQQNPALSLDSSNNVYAVWQDERNGAGKPDIFSSKRSAGGGTWSTPNLRVNDDGNPLTVQRNPRIAGTAGGAQTAVWVDLRSSQNNIYGSTLPAGGSAWAANKRVTDNTAAAKDFPDITVAADGTSHAVWQDSRNGNADIFFSSLTSGGAAWAANAKISDDPGTAAQTKPRIGVDASGNLFAAWIDARTTPARVRAARRPSGGSWSASVEVSPAPANVQSLALSVRPDGSAWALWGDTRGTSQDIWGSRYDATTATWAIPVRLDDDSGGTAQSSPTVAFSGSEFSTAWRDDRAGNADVRGRRFVFNPGTVDHFTLNYDGLNRLTAVTGPVPETFTLDGASNITGRTGPSQTDTYDQANRLTSDGSLSYTWSNADRLTNRGSDTFSYDPLDRLTSSTVVGTTRAYAYNGDGLLQSRTQGSTTPFLWDPATSPSRLLKLGSDNIVYGLGPLYVVKSDTTTLTFARDGSKSVRAEVSTSGSVSAAFRYRAYGQLSQASGSTPSYFGLASHLIDPTGLYFMRARWYDVAAGRFLSRDPGRGDETTPASLNAFAYANSNPALLGDPTGLAAKIDNAGDECDSEQDCLAPHRENWAYAIADVFHDLDSAETGTRVAAFAKVGLTGIAAGAVVATGVFAAAAVAAGGTAGAAAASGVATASAEASTAAAAIETSTTLLVTQLPARAIAGAGTTVLLRDAPRLIATYGGRLSDWAKMTTVDAWRVPWMRATVQGHWYENVQSGLQVELKLAEHFWKK